VGWTGSLGDIRITGDFSSNDIGLSENQPRFSVLFDIPLDQNIEDYALDTGSQKVPLLAMRSPVYDEDSQGS
jgi:hypothetical protein